MRASRLRIPVRLAAALLAVLPGCGLASAEGWGDRGRDLADCFTLTVSAGPEVSADLKLTEALQLVMLYRMPALKM